MSTDTRDAAGKGGKGQTPVAQRGSKLKWTFIVLVLLVLVGGAAVYWALFARIYNLEVYRTAMAKIAADKQVQAALGQPVETVHWSLPSARVESGETEVRWTIKGPQGTAKAHVLAKMMMGKWQTPVLEVLLADGKKIQVQDAGDDEAEAPAFHGAAPKGEAKKVENNAPPPNLDMQVPAMDGPGGN